MLATGCLRVITGTKKPCNTGNTASESLFAKSHLIGVRMAQSSQLHNAFAALQPALQVSDKSQFSGICTQYYSWPTNPCVNSCDKRVLLSDASEAARRKRIGSRRSSAHECFSSIGNFY